MLLFELPIVEIYSSLLKDVEDERRIKVRTPTRIVDGGLDSESTFQRFMTTYLTGELQECCLLVAKSFCGFY